MDEALRLSQPADGRNVDPGIGTLSGEGASIVTHRPLERAHPATETLMVRPGDAEASATTGLPILKEPVWEWMIPVYFYAGGVTGAAGVLGAAATLTRRPELARLGRRLSLLGATMNGVGTACLVADLGRPSRFLNMLRVFRPTSPMNVGTWVLTASSAMHGAAALLPRGRLSRALAVAGGVFDLPMAGYTAVLLGSTAVPVWLHARRSLPVLFVGASMASAGSLLQLLRLEDHERRVVHGFGLTGKMAELAAMEVVERECAAASDVVAEPLRRGPSGRLWRAAKALSAASLVLSILPGQTDRRRTVAGLLGTAAALALRFALAKAGEASAREPRAVIEPQRKALQAREAARLRPAEHRPVAAHAD